MPLHNQPPEIRQVTPNFSVPAARRVHRPVAPQPVDFIQMPDEEPRLEPMSPAAAAVLKGLTAFSKTRTAKVLGWTTVVVLLGAFLVLGYHLANFDHAFDTTMGWLESLKK